VEEMIAVVYGLIASVLGAFGALFLKKGAVKLSARRPFNLFIALGGVLYVLTTVFFVFGLRYAQLSFLFPFTGLLYAFAALLGLVLLKERWSAMKTLGLVFILAGVVLVSLGNI
jgi:drug/metabolite transporter (DMT)-like permease